MQKPQIRVGTHRDKCFWCYSRCIACTKRQVMSGTHRDLLFGSKSCCFACKHHRWGLGPIETSNSCAKVALFHAQNDRFCLGLLQTCYSGPKVAVLHAKTTDEGWDPERLVIHVLKLLFSMHKTTGFVWDLRVLLFRSKSRCFACKKHTWGLGRMETSNSDAKHAVFHAQNDRWELEPI